MLLLAPWLNPCCLHNLSDFLVCSLPTPIALIFLLQGPGFLPIYATPAWARGSAQGYCKETGINGLVSLVLPVTSANSCSLQQPLFRYGAAPWREETVGDRERVPVGAQAGLSPEGEVLLDSWGRGTCLKGERRRNGGGGI